LFQVDSGRYESKGDFNVVLQPGLEGLKLPEAEQEGGGGRLFGRPFRDLSYLAPNCIYPSQKLHATSEIISIYQSR
jgi:hypothetical protein